MDIIWLLLRSSWISVTVAVVSGLISGVGSAALIALINTAIEQGTPQALILPFAGLAFFVLVTGSVSQFLSFC